MTTKIPMSAKTQRPLRAPTPEPITLDPVRPNAGIRVAYRRKLDALIAQMHDSLVYWLTAAYRAQFPELAADDRIKTKHNPAGALNAAMADLAQRWQRRFDEAAQDLAAHFAQRIADRADGALEAILQKGGFTVKFTLSDEMRTVVQAAVEENVGLIKSIAQRHLADVQGLVMRSVQQGRNLKDLTDDLQRRYRITRRRAAFIARDQNEKATAAVVRTRQQALGITEAIWTHSGAGKEPRPEHVKWGRQRKRYKIARGMWSQKDQAYVWPGTAINCRCTARSIIPGLHD